MVLAAGSLPSRSCPASEAGGFGFRRRRFEGGSGRLAEERHSCHRRDSVPKPNQPPNRRKFTCHMAEREGLLGAPRLAPAGPPCGRYPRFVAPASTDPKLRKFTGPVAEREGLFAAAPLVLRCAPDCRRALRGSVQLGRRPSSCRTGLVVCRRFELLGSAGRHELPENFFVTLVRPDGFEPPTPWFEARYSIQLSYGRPRAV